MITVDGETKKIPTDVSSIKLQKIKVKFDLTTLNMIISFIFKDSVLRTRKSLHNIYKLFNSLDMTFYDENIYLKSRVWIIKKALHARIIENYDTGNEFIIQYLRDDIECDEVISSILDDIENMKISYDESKYLIKKIDDILEYGYIVTVKDVMRLILDNIDDDFKSYKAVEEDLYDLATSIINIKRYTKSMGSTMAFSLQDEVFDNIIDDAMQKLTNRNRIFLTGVQLWNSLLSPGYLSKRLYTYLAFPGKGKSTILLKSAIDIRRYNKIQTKDPDKRPAVLFLTLENDIAETIERLYNMTVDNDDIRNYSSRQIKKKLKKDGRLELTNDNNIDIIIMEYKNREIDTNDLYGIINDLSDQGIETVALILDYMKRIRPAEKANDEKTELKNISNELKELAKFFDIPVITAQQLNRSGASVIDAALQANKEDVTRLVGRDSIAGAWEILENSDWTCIINPEAKRDTNEIFLTFKLLKRRYRSIESDTKIRRLEYFNQPFFPDSEIRLMDDLELDKPLGIESLSNNLAPVEEKKMIPGIPKKKSKEKDEKEITDFDPFDYNKASNF